MGIRRDVERIEPKAQGRINVSNETDFVFPDNDYTIKAEFDDEKFPTFFFDNDEDIFKMKIKKVKKQDIIGKYEYKPPYEPPSILSASGKDKKVERTGRLVYNAEPSTQEKALKKYHHYANKYKIPITTKERGKKTLAELARDINAYEQKNRDKILKQPIDVKFKERGLYLVDV
jgi:hypothetical protein